MRLIAATHRDLKAWSEAGTCPGLEAFIGQRLGSGTDDLHAQAHFELDRILLARVLEHTQGSQRPAARVLGIARKTLRLRRRQLGLNLTHPGADQSHFSYHTKRLVGVTPAQFRMSPRIA